MIVYRIVKAKYADRLTSSGSANRWNYQGQYVLYCSGSISLCTLELLVHSAYVKPTKAYKLLHISVPDDSIQAIEPEKLPNDWRSIKRYPSLQYLGGQWYSKKDSLLLSIPSAVIPQETNYIINTEHEAIKQVKIVDQSNYFWDDRLFDSNRLNLSKSS